MTQLTEKNLTFTFRSGWLATKYDKWEFYNKIFKTTINRYEQEVKKQNKNDSNSTKIKPTQAKAIDILAYNPFVSTTWLIEVKDYSQHPRKKTMDILDEMTFKVFDSLAGLVAAQFHAENKEERELAKQAIQAKSLHVVLHLEQPIHPHRHNRTHYDVSKLQQKLRKRLSAIDSTAKVMDKNFSQKHWQVT